MSDHDELFPMRFQWNRVGSFVLCPYFDQMPIRSSSLRLAGNGFYFCDKQQRIKCFYCQTVADFSNNEHQWAHKSFCNWQRPNVAFGQHAEQVEVQDLLSMIGVKPKDGCNTESESESTRPRSLEDSYKNQKARLESFRVHFSGQIDGSYIEFADGGFFALPGCRLQCYSCGLQTSPRDLKRRAEELGRVQDNYVFRVHADQSPQCAFINATYEIQEPSPAAPQPVISVSATPDPGVCCRCGQRPVDAVFQPCGHLVSCADCCEYFGTCPQCRARIETIVKIYLN